MFYIWLIIIGLLQATVFKGFNIMLLLAIFAGMKKGPLAGFLIGGAIGAFLGIFSISSFGLNIGLYCFIGLASGILKVRLFYKREDFLMEMAFSFCGVLLYYFLYFILTDFSHPSIFLSAFFLAITAPFIFRVVDTSLHTHAN
ncbi:MAG: hypothetical protein QGI05_00785 [Candidatus Omnitrophota bacterium]|jgi:hypothetical protein|nr:hypothetical protein [Candidatus Omnitrophota bacterium]